jgi:hypothetical protein
MAITLSGLVHLEGSEMAIELGKITIAKFGKGGYQDAMIGLTVQLEGQNWGTADFKGFWAGSRSKDAKWTEEDRKIRFGEAVIFMTELLTKAKKDDVSKLVGVPVEVTFENGKLESWRVLTEVL